MPSTSLMMRLLIFASSSCGRRAQCSLDIRRLKPQAHQGLYDPKREEEIFTNVAKCNEGPMYSDPT